MPIREAAAFKIRHPFAGQALAKLIEQARLAASCFRHGEPDKPRMVMTISAEQARLVLKTLLAQLEGRISEEEGRAD